MAGTLIDLKNKIKSYVTLIEPIKQFIMDDLSAINSNSQNEYPVLIMKPPQSIFQDRIMEYQTYDMDMFLFQPELSDDLDHWTEKWDECQDLLRSVLKLLFADNPGYVLVDNNIQIGIGHFQHNDKLIGARAQFKLRVYYGC